MREAVERQGAEASIAFVPALEARECLLEAIDAGVRLVVYLGKNMPVHDMMLVKRRLREKGVHMIGPNGPGIICPGEAKIGFMPDHCYRRGPVGLISRGGSLSYEVANTLSRAGIGQSTAIGIGGDPVKGMDFAEAIELFAGDAETRAIVLIGSAGGTAEEHAARAVRKKIGKPVIAYVAGHHGVRGRGQTADVTGNGKGAFAAKIAALRDAGARIADLPCQIPALVRRALPE
jgi:succinyl-CoA synthetase alpha subunit